MNTRESVPDDVDAALLEAYSTSFLQAIHEAIGMWVRTQPDGVVLPWGTLMRAGLLWEVAWTIRSDIAQGSEETDLLAEVVEVLADAILTQRGLGEDKAHASAAESDQCGA